MTGKAGKRRGRGKGGDYPWFSRARAAHLFQHAEEILIAYLLAGMMVNTFAQVVARRLFNSGWVWANELTQLLFAWLVMLGISYGIRQGTHIGVDFAVRFFSRANQKRINLIAVLISLVYCGAMFAAAAGMVWTYYTQLGFIRTEDLDIPQWVNYLVIACGFALMIMRLVIAGRDIYQGTREAVSATHEAEDLIERAGSPEVKS